MNNNKKYIKLLQEDFKSQKQEILQEIESYNLHLSNLTIMSIFSLLGGKRFNLLNLGQAGIGKSRSTLDMIRQLNLSNVVFVSGHVTPLKFFELLESNPSSTFVIDESSSLLQSNSEIVHLLRSALYDSHVVWYSSFKDQSGNQVVREVNFTGNIIFNLNHFQSFNMNDKALLDRLYVSNIRLTTAQIIDKMEDEYKPNAEVWRVIRDRIIAIRNGQIKVELDQDEEQEIKDYIINKIKEITLSYNSNISVRLFERIREIFYRFKLFFGGIDWKYCKRLADNYFIDVNASENFIQKAIASNNGRIKIKELVKIISDFEHVSLRTAYRRINEFCELYQNKIRVSKREIEIIKE